MLKISRGMDRAKISKDAAWNQPWIRCSIDIVDNASMPEQIQGATGKLQLRSGACMSLQVCASYLIQSRLHVYCDKRCMRSGIDTESDLYSGHKAVHTIEAHREET